MGKTPKVDILMGMQYGSEGKGFVAAFLAHQGLYDAYVRSGGPNAGHCLLHEGEEYKMRQVPCGWVDPKAELFLGPAMVINVDVLEDEVRTIEVKAEMRVRHRIHVHPHAVIVTPAHMAEEAASIRGSIGSTAEGVGAARRAKMSRVEGAYVLAKDCPRLGNLVHVCETPRDWLLKLHLCNNILLEGTQGAGLCLTHGQYPFTTSWPCTATQLLSDAGLPMSSVRHIIGVVRTKPIRVAGNSGPLANETTFAELGQPEEHTTVTKKVRRVAADIDWEELDKNMAINRPTVIALTFGDYLTPPERDRLISKLEATYHARVGYVGISKDGTCIRKADPFMPVVKQDDEEAEVSAALDSVYHDLKATLLHKRSRYGTENINEGGEVGIFYRLFDKVHRLKNLLVDHKGTYTDEENPWLDAAGYSLIQLVRQRIGRW